MSRLPTFSDPEVLSKIAGLSLRARRVVEGTLSGMHRSPYHGFSVEFAEYREYSPGDDLRRLDWRVFGRTDRYYVKEFEDESNLRATIAMDASASMRYGSGPLTKFEYGATIAAAIATLLIGQRDPVGLALFDERRAGWLPPAATHAQLAEIVNQLESAKPDRQTELGEVLADLSGQIRGRGMIIIISDLLTDLDSFYDGLARLQYRGHEILVMQVLDADELDLPFDDLVLFHDIEGEEEVFAEPRAFRKAYRELMEQFVDQLRTGLGGRGVDHVLLRTDQNASESLSRYLHLRQRTHHIRSKT